MTQPGPENRHPSTRCFSQKVWLSGSDQVCCATFIVSAQCVWEQSPRGGCWGGRGGDLSERAVSPRHGSDSDCLCGDG